MKRILITGAAGLVGGCLTQELLAQHEQCELFCALRSQDASARLMRKLQAVELPTEAVKIHKIDLEDFEAVEKMILEIMPDVVFHTAAKVSLSDQQGEKMVSGNVDMTHFLTDCLLKARGERQGYDPLMVHVSSIAAFGLSDPSGSINENTPFTDIANASAYARSKFLSQNDVVRASKMGLRTIIVNPSVILGINSGLGQMQTLFEMIGRGMPFYTEGEMGYVDARDVARAMISLSQTPKSEGNIYCLNGSNLTFKEFITQFGKPFERKAPTIRIGKRLLRIAEGLAWIWSKISSSRPLLTPAIVGYLTSHARYDGSKILEDIPGFSYRSIEDTANFIAKNIKTD